MVGYSKLIVTAGKAVTGQVKIYEQLPRVTGALGCPVLAGSTTLQTKKFDPELGLSSLSP
jgi:hypothetical protein